MSPSLVDLSEDMSGEQFEHLALEHGVYVYGSQRFAVGKDMPVHAARLGICVPSSMMSYEKA